MTMKRVDITVPESELDRGVEHILDGFPEGVYTIRAKNFIASGSLIEYDPETSALSSIPNGIRVIYTPREKKLEKKGKLYWLRSILRGEDAD